MRSRFAIIYCLPFLFYILILTISGVINATLDRAHTAPNHLNKPFIPPHVAPLTGTATTFLVALMMALRSHEHPEIYFAMLVQSGVLLNLIVFPPRKIQVFWYF